MSVSRNHEMAVETLSVQSWFSFCGTGWYLNTFPVVCGSGMSQRPTVYRNCDQSWIDGCKATAPCARIDVVPFL